MTQDLTNDGFAERLRLVLFEVSGLYDEFDYRIPLNTDSHVTAIIAPNGSGKTLCLRLMNALFKGDWMLLEKTSFHRAVYHFSDGTRIEASKPQAQLELDDDEGLPTSLIIKVQDRFGRQYDPWTPHQHKKRTSSFVEQYLPFLQRVGVSSWLDRRTGEQFSFHEVMNNFADDIPSHIRRRLSSQQPEHISRVLSQINCTLIETQRLIILNDTDDARIPGSGRELRKPQYAISRKASTLKEIISREMNRYAALSQSLDRTFPGRVISKAQSLPQVEIEQQLLVLDAKRRELMEVGILDIEQDVPMALPTRQLDPAIARVLSVYIEDNRKKLDSLDPLYERIALFKKLIDDRFGRKDVKISKQKGLNVVYSDRDIPIETLSSGEQHQLVLFFELLFETEKNSLILIDEPEISLHVSWQKKFIADLMSIIDLNKFDVVLATHSPQLIGRWGNLVVELGDVFGGDRTPDWTGAQA